MIYILEALGLMCFDGIHREYFDLRCNLKLENAYVISDKPCATFNDKVVSESFLKYKKVIKIKHNPDGSINSCIVKPKTFVPVESNETEVVK